MWTKMTWIVAILVTFVWTVSHIADAFIATYDPPAGVNTAFAAVLSATIGSFALKGRGDHEQRA